MKTVYVHKTFRGASETIIDQANAIIGEYQAQGFDLTLRQLYYQFVARDILPNQQKAYKRLGSIISDARLAGLIDWNAIEDRTRSLRGNSHWNSPSDIIEGCAWSFRFDTWTDQDNYCEVWIEKDALVGVLARVCRTWDVDYFSCRGYTSQSAMYRAAQRHIRKARDGRACHILHLGDHDPSGIDMTRDIEDRFSVFRADVTVHRLALNMDQVEEYNPPPNPAKMSDARAEDYVSRYGYDSWELDALEPATIETLIADKLQELVDEDVRQGWLDRQEEARRLIRRVADDWENVVDYVG